MYKLLTVIIGASFLLASCGSSTVQKEGPAGLKEKKERLDSLNAQKGRLEKEISTLQAEVDKLDTASATKEKAKLVTLATLAPTSFTHYIDLQGNVDAVNTAWISPRGSGGVVTKLYVKQGDHVKQGQLLAKLDDAIQRQNLATDQTQLAHDQDLYQRRKNLWDEKIGTEVDLVNAKNQVDLSEARVKIDQQQLDYTSVYADFSGTVNALNIKVGEAFTQLAQAIQIVNTDNLKVDVLVPEIYQERVRVGTPVKIDFPGLNNKEITGTVTIAGKVINQDNRAFQVEIHIPNSSDIRANQVAIVKLQDYSATNAITIPINTLQTDETGKYVLVGVQQQDRLVARKRSITIGQTYGDKVQVTGGLQPGDRLITDGYQGLYDGQLITMQ
ncbi:MAG TPA: efflux RND transporter periplasmic adaptor subunit [Puia sp.]|jgi:RND family efflux transporter MFP subunit|nr:efflux RND transporter periplasmic adaptor subunit [Puia sp.]